MCKKSYKPADKLRYRARKLSLNRWETQTFQNNSLLGGGREEEGGGQPPSYLTESDRQVNTVRFALLNRCYPT